MADIKYYDVILKPVITEKSMAGMGEKKYTFLVHNDPVFSSGAAAMVSHSDLTLIITTGVLLQRSAQLPALVRNSCRYSGTQY